jgi:hypothetical protein
MDLFIVSLAILVASFGGHLIVHPVMQVLRRHIKFEDAQRDWLATWLGCLERAMFVSAWFLNFPQFIGLWLSLKVAGGWKMWQEDAHSRGCFTIFLIGSGVSIFVAVTVALAAQRWFSGV